MALADQSPFILGEVPSFASLSVGAFSTDLTKGLRGLTVNDEDGYEIIHTGGSNATGYGKQPRSVTGTLTLLTPVWHALALTAPQSRLALLPRNDVTVVMEVEGVLYKYAIEQVKLNAKNFSTSQGDTSIPHDIPFIAGAFRAVPV